MRKKPQYGWPCAAVAPSNEECLDQLICANHRIMTRKLCTQLYDGFNVLETMIANLEHLCAEMKTFLLQHDNNRPHTSLKIGKHIAKLGWTIPIVPPYSPDLIPSDFQLSGPMKDEFVEKIFLTMTPSKQL